MEKESQAKKQFCLANDCTKILPKSRRKYCSDKCARRIKQRAYRAKKTASEYHIEKDIDHNIQKAEVLQNFDYDGYHFNLELSRSDKWVFSRE